MYGTSLGLRLRWWCVLLGVACCGSAGAAAVWACDTPVYRYAMYRWEPAPFEVYSFYRSSLDDLDVAVRDAADRLSGSLPPAANLMFVAVDVDRDTELREVPPDVRDAWLQSPQQTPWYLVASPSGAHLYSGAMTVELLQALVESPQRAAIGDQLAAGRAGVFVLVKGEDPGANQEAESVVRQVLDDLAAGRLAFYAPPAASESSSEATIPEFGLITLDRTDEAEKWLIATLLRLEPDLLTRPEPMAFLVYGRGRAMFSCLGKGICPDNLEEDISVITGACSCIVKEENPGTDLLMRYDWDEVATELAARFGAEEGSLYRFGGDMLFPELMLPTDELLATPASAEGVATGFEPVATAELVASAADVVTPPSVAADAVTQSAPASASTAPPNSTRMATPSEAAPGTPAASADHVPIDPLARTWHATLWVGGGLAGALAVLLVATWLVLRPR